MSWEVQERVVPFVIFAYIDMADLKEIPCCIFCFKMGNYITEFFQMLKIGFGKQTLGRTQVIYRVKGRSRSRVRAHTHTHTRTFNTLCAFHCLNIRYV
jgi:hypothetical protein